MSVVHCGFAGQSDEAIWHYAWEHDYVVVTTNASDFLSLLNVELHPGLIVLREGGLTRDEQWERLSQALDHLRAQPDPDAFMVNRVIEVVNSGEVVVHDLPPL